MPSNHKAWLTIPLLLFPMIAAAHVIPLSTSGFKAGFMHPWTGFDHTLAILSVGILAKQVKGWGLKLPLIFIGGLALGGAVGYLGFALSWVHAGIALSVIILGAMIALPTHLSTLVLSFLVLIFAFCHGHPHGFEMSHYHHPVLFASGFMTATFCLLVLGLSLGLLIEQTMHKQGMRLSGLGISLFGMWLVV